jgi:hypothetical protein
MRPPTIVATAAPVIDLPLNGVFRLFDREAFTSKVHSHAGSRMVTSAWAFAANVPRSCKPKTRAGLVEQSATSLSRSIMPR